MEYEHIVHPFPPLFDENSEILILGSLPSVHTVTNNIVDRKPIVRTEFFDG